MQNSSNSFLSERVRFLIFGLNEDYLKEHRTENTCSGNITDEITVKDFNFVVKNDENSIDFVQSVKNLLPTCHEIHNQLMQLTDEQFDRKYGMDLDWTDCRERIVECFTMLKSKDPCHHILSYVLMFPILEHCLGDVYQSTTTSKQCPTNLKELLAAKEIQYIVGEDVAMTMYVMAGPPQGLNLRNVIWHGFVSENEIPPQYGSFLILMMTQIGRRLTNLTIKRRPMMTFSNLDTLFEVFPKIDIISVLSEILNIDNCFISQTKKLRIWEKALSFYKEKKYGFAMILLLPQLEHSLRMAFAWANQCPGRVLTAESTTLYTTFDEILAPSLPDGSENQLITKMGNQCIEMLMDILVHSEGPRIRDHLSHGEVDLDTVSQDLCHHIICICTAFVVRFSQDSKTLNIPLHTMAAFTELSNANSKTKKAEVKQSNITEIAVFHSEEKCYTIDVKLSTVENTVEKQSNGTISERSSTTEANSRLTQTIQIAENYQAIYHPLAILNREIRSSSKLFEKLDEVLVPNELQIDVESDGASSLQRDGMIQKALNALNSKKVFAVDLVAVCLEREFSKVVKDLCDEIRLKTLYRPKKELEVAALLHSIVKHCSTMATQVLDIASQRYHQWQNKELRSRQRTNYKRLATVLPSYRSVLRVTLLVVAVELSSLQTKELEPKYIRFLKRCLQFSENLESLSCQSKNRWDECNAVCDQLLELIVNNYTHGITTGNSGLFELSEVAKHSSEDDLWIIIDDKVYDVTSYVTRHPGGNAILRHAGGNATQGFRSEKAHSVVTSHIENLLRTFYIGNVTSV